MFLSVGLVVLRGSPGKRARPEEARAVLQLDSGVPGGRVP